MIQRESFQKDYDHFWSLAPIDRSDVNGSFVPLVFVMLAMGTQFVALPSPDEKEQTAEFYGNCLCFLNKHHINEAHIDLHSLGITSSPKGDRIPQSTIDTNHPNHGTNRLLPNERQSRRRRLGLRRHPHPPSVRPRPKPRPINRRRHRPPRRKATTPQTMASRSLPRHFPHRHSPPPPHSHPYRRPSRRPRSRIRRIASRCLRRDGHYLHLQYVAPSQHSPINSLHPAIATPSHFPLPDPTDPTHCLLPRNLHVLSPPLPQFLRNLGLRPRASEQTTCAADALPNEQLFPLFDAHLFRRA